MYINMQRHFTHNSQNLKTAQMSNSRWITTNCPWRRYLCSGASGYWTFAPMGSRREWRGRQRGQKVSDTDLAWRCLVQDQRTIGWEVERELLSKRRVKVTESMWDLSRNLRKERWAWHNSFEGRVTLGRNQSQEDFRKLICDVLSS